ncbi:MAG: radical SAM protein [Coriobacteriales bacterium]|jgi:putative pyruvate formate lyase activating enzyme|nr:radical SAM protein [Coriobacteriales bacterium]
MVPTLPDSCTLCPRACGANREAGERGICGADDTLLVARAALHHWEEPPISGNRGSGTVFFSNCSLRCVYCQNEPLSSGRVGRAITVERLAAIFSELAEQGAHNINLVTPTHYVPQILVALEMARERGTTLPVVYNTSGYEALPTLTRLAGLVDIYLTDFKYASAALATRYSQAPDYPAVALKALQAMVEQTSEAGGYVLDEAGILQTGVVVRHLMLPGQLEDSKAVLEMAYDAVGNQVCYSLMNQYTPMSHLEQFGTGQGLGQGDTCPVSPSHSPRIRRGRRPRRPATAPSPRPAAPFEELQTTVAEDEYSELVAFALDLGITNSFMQEGGTATESFIPAFDLTGVPPQHVPVILGQA